MQVTIVDHPIVQARLTVMRDARSTNSEFRAALRELATLLVYEETSGLPQQLFTASIDERLNDQAYIVPGLGDAGDRQFGPR